MSKKLTLNLGLRYEINLAPIYGNDILSNFDPSVPNPGADGRLGALVFAGNGPGRQNTRSAGAELVWRHRTAARFCLRPE